MPRIGTLHKLSIVRPWREGHHLSQHRLCLAAPSSPLAASQRVVQERVPHTNQADASQCSRYLRGTSDTAYDYHAIECASQLESFIEKMRPSQVLAKNACATADDDTTPGG